MVDDQHAVGGKIDVVFDGVGPGYIGVFGAAQRVFRRIAGLAAVAGDIGGAGHDDALVQGFHGRDDCPGGSGNDAVGAGRDHGIDGPGIGGRLGPDRDQPPLEETDMLQRGALRVQQSNFGMTCVGEAGGAPQLLAGEASVSISVQILEGIADRAPHAGTGCGDLLHQGGVGAVGQNGDIHEILRRDPVLDRLCRPARRRGRGPAGWCPPSAPGRRPANRREAPRCGHRPSARCPDRR